MGFVEFDGTRDMNFGMVGGKAFTVGEFCQ